MKKRVLSWLLALVMLVGLLPMGALAARMETDEVVETPVLDQSETAEMPPMTALAAGEISVTVRFSAPGVAEDLARLRTDLLNAGAITEDDTQLPGDITVTVPSGSTVKAVLEAAKAKQDFAIAGLDDGYVTKVGFLDEAVAQALVNNTSNLNWPGWSFFIDGVALSTGVGADTVTTDGAVVEGLFSVYNTWDGTANAMVYHDVELVTLYHGLDAMTKQNVDTSGFSQTAKEAYNTAKREAETLLANLYAQAKLNDTVAATYTEPYPDFNTSDGLWIGFIESKGLTLYGPGSPIEQLQKATEKLEEAAKGISYGPCDLTALSVTDLTNVSGSLTLKPAFSYDVTSYAVDAVDYQQYAKMAYVKATAASASATITATLGGTSKEVTSGGSATNFNNMVPGENNQLVITVTNGGETKTYTVTIPMKDADGNLPGADPDPSPALDVMHAIAAKYAASGIASDANAPWLAADMAAYAKAFPDTQNKLSEAQKQACLNVLIPQADAAVKPGDLAKYIIALRAMGYDARNLTTADGKKVDAVKKLTDLVDAKDTRVNDVYTLPYVLIALRQGAGYATAEQITYLKGKALEIKEKWQTLQWGSTDAAPPMILALSPYCAESAVKTEIDAAVQFLKDNQDNATGALMYNSKPSASSTGLAIMALASVGVDPAQVKTSSGKSLIDGLMATKNGTGDGFDNAFGTEQGFRGLAAWQLMQKAQGKAQVYDFADLPAAPAAAQAANCPVRFNLVPAGAKVTVKQGSTTVKPVATGGLYYDLPAGEYSYTATLSGYNNATGTFTVTADEAANHTAKTVSVSLTSKPSESETEDLSITVKVLAHDGDECNNQWTYKHNAEKYTVVIADQTVTVKKGQTAFDAFALAMSQAGKTYTEKTAGYINEIAGYEEFDHGPNSGWQYMIGSTLPTVTCREYALTSNATMTWFYTDDYTREKGSEQWSGSSSSSSSSEPKVTVTTGTDGKPVAKVELPRNATSAVATIPTADLGEGNVLVIVKADGTEEILKKSLVDGETASALLNGSVTVKLVDNTKSFTDTANHWAGDSIAFVTSHELFQGTSGGTFSPDAPMNRAMLATVLYRLEDAEADGGNPFADVAADTWYTDAVTWASANQIVSGTGSGFAPDRDLSRQELVTMLYRYAKSVGMDTGKTTDLDGYADAAEVADWAAEAMAWAVKSGLIAGRGGAVLAPEGTATRAEVATILQRLVALMVK